MKVANFFANIIWFIFGGLITGILWVLFGILLCITIVGIPLGKQCFKMAHLTFAPFGKEITYNGKTGATIANIIWAIVAGWETACVYLVCGVINCITIVGIPGGLQSFKMARLALMPFGSKVEKKEYGKDKKKEN